MSSRDLKVNLHLPARARGSPLLLPDSGAGRSVDKMEDTGRAPAAAEHFQGLNRVDLPL